MKTYDFQTTCDRMFKLAEERGWTDAKIAKMLRITPQAVSKWRRHVCSPGIDMIVTFAGFFDVKLDDMIGCFDVDMQPEPEDER